MKNKNNSFLKEKQITFKGINPSKADSLTMVLPKEVVVWSPYEAADINRLVQEQKPPFIYAGGDKLDDVGWYYENNHHETKPVGLKLPNLLDLYDMSGNVGEWCSDCYNPYKDVVDRDLQGIRRDVEKAVGAGTRRVMRGGGWDGVA